MVLWRFAGLSVKIVKKVLGDILSWQSTEERNMERFCNFSNCQTKLKNYQNQVNKLNAEIAGLEDDFKERDDFLQIVLKEVILKKKPRF